VREPWSLKLPGRVTLGSSSLLSTMSEAAAQYKKQDGKISVSADGRIVSWRASSGNLAVDVEIAAITSMSTPTKRYQPARHC
jgi:hypothetical protein